MSIASRLLTLLVLLMGVWAKAQTPVVIALFDAPLQTDHGARVNKFLKSKLKDCTSCAVKHFNFFSSDGKVDLTQLQQRLQNLPADVKILHFSWNVPYEKKYDQVIEIISRIIKKGTLVVAASGESQDPAEINRPISETVMGKIPGVILVGELNAKGRLSNRAYYGSEIRISYPSISGYEGSSFTSLLETAKRARQLSGKSSLKP